MGVGGDYRATDKGAHVREPRDWGMCLGPTAWSSNVSATFLLVSLPYNMLETCYVKPVLLDQPVFPTLIKFLTVSLYKYSVVGAAVFHVQLYKYST